MNTCCSSAAHRCSRVRPNISATCVRATACSICFDLVKERDAKRLNECCLPISACSKPTCSRAEYRNGVDEGLVGASRSRRPARQRARGRTPISGWRQRRVPGRPTVTTSRLNLSGYSTVPPTGAVLGPGQEANARTRQVAEGEAEQPVRAGIPNGRFHVRRPGFLSPVRPRASFRSSRMAEPSSRTDLDRVAHHRRLPRRISILAEHAEITLGSDPCDTTSRFRSGFGRCVICDLRRRGGGVRESGAFLLGRDDANPARVTSYICYDDVDPAAYQHGAIAFHAAGCAALWQHCKKRALQLLDRRRTRILVRTSGKA